MENSSQLGNLLLRAILNHHDLDALEVEGVPNLGTDVSALTRNPELLFPPGARDYRMFFAPQRVKGSRISPTGDKAGE